MATETNLSIPRGSKVTLNFSKTPAGVLPGSTIKFTVARRANSATKVIGPKDCTVTSAPNGTYTCVLDADDTDITPSVYLWDTRCVDSGAETLLGYGLFEVTAIAQLPTA